MCLVRYYEPITFMPTVFLYYKKGQSGSYMESIVADFTVGHFLRIKECDLTIDTYFAVYMPV